MPLSPPVCRRALKHTRTIQAEAFARDDGLWDVDAHISDVKTDDAKLASGIRPAGMPIHDMWLRLTVDTELTIVGVEAVSDAVPYAGFCDTISHAYEKLVGLNLLNGFRRGLMERLGGMQGCTHISELAGFLPTATLQAFAGAVLSTRDSASDDAKAKKPFQLDRCHALRSDGGAVAKYYPRWAIEPDSGSNSSEPIQ